MIFFLYDILQKPTTYVYSPKKYQIPCPKKQTIIYTTVFYTFLHLLRSEMPTPTRPLCPLRELQGSSGRHLQRSGECNQVTVLRSDFVLRSTEKSPFIYRSPSPPYISFIFVLGLIIYQHNSYIIDLQVDDIYMAFLQPKSCSLSVAILAL